MRQNKIAVYMGRFQPLHAGYMSVLKYIADKYKNIIVLLGEQKEEDCLSFSHRASIMRDELRRLGFNNWWVVPIYDHTDWNEWARHIYNSVQDTQSDTLITPPSKFVLIKPKKKCDINKEGFHYLDWPNLNELFPFSEEVPITYDVSASILKKDFFSTDQGKRYTAHSMIHEQLWQYLEEGIGEKNIFKKQLASTINEWMSVRDNDHFTFSHRRNKDSIAFIFYNRLTKQYGLIIEGKPPIGSKKEFSAFGGSFDREKDNPYRIVWQEMREEAGITSGWPEYIGTYMATTQSDEMVHVFVVHTDEMNFNPQTKDEREKGNKCIWLNEEYTRLIPDWRIQLCVRQ